MVGPVREGPELPPCHRHAAAQIDDFVLARVGDVEPMVDSGAEQTVDKAERSIVGLPEAVQEYMVMVGTGGRRADLVEKLRGIQLERSGKAAYDLNRRGRGSTGGGVAPCLDRGHIRRRDSRLRRKRPRRQPEPPALIANPATKRLEFGNPILAGQPKSWSLLPDAVLSMIKQV